jgi:hypothetical protein
MTLLTVVRYHLIYSDGEVGSRQVEADTFFLFMNLMSRMNYYIEDLDETNHGILHIMSEIHELIRHLDPELWDHLVMDPFVFLSMKIFLVDCLMYFS